MGPQSIAYVTPNAWRFFREWLREKMQLRRKWGAI